jgi:hypothetical protein
MKRETVQKLTLLLLSCFSCLLVFEIAARFLISPSQRSYGTFLGRELPPLKLGPYISDPPDTDRDEWYNNLIVEGRKITVGDLWGYFREDPLLGYVTEESTISMNGWWQSNNLGARARRDTPKDRLQGKKRILVFGESFAHGSRLPQEETWPSFLDSESDEAEVINFGVDGYSMAQAFLRYREIGKKIDHDLVLLMFVPSADLWRDINTIRILAENSWDDYLVMPRFIIEQSELKLVQSPYGIKSKIYTRKEDTLSEELKNYLENYDRFYFEPMIEEAGLISKTIVYKLFARAHYELRRKGLANNLFKPDSEAMRVSRKIFEAMNDEVKRDGKEFVLIILPMDNDLKKLQDKSWYRNAWHKMATAICVGDLLCVDLAKDLQQIPVSLLDKGYDGSHYGPKANRLIAGLIRKHLDNLRAL